MHGLAHRPPTRVRRARVLRRVHLPGGGAVAPHAAGHHQDPAARRLDPVARLHGAGAMTIASDAEIHTLATPYALHALPADEVELFERHLAECSACRSEVDEIRETSSRLGLAMTTTPPPQMKP